MMKIRRSEERGHANHGWLLSKHTFSFASYYDPQHMHFGPLRVINEDRIAGGSGFDQHPHRDMEIISYVLKGALRHQDSMGNKTVIRPGEVQRMSAGTGILHSEYNDSEEEQAHFLQIWVIPNELSLKPGYGQKSFAKDLEEKKLVLVVSQDGREGSLAMHQDADIYISRLKAGETLEFVAKPERGYWLQMIKGEIGLLDEYIKAGDGAALTGESLLSLRAKQDAEVMIFDMVAT